MAADFGALEEFIDDYDVAFEFRGKEYKESFDFATVSYTHLTLPTNREV